MSKQLFPAPKQGIPAHAKLRPFARNGKLRLRYFVTSLTETCDVDFEAICMSMPTMNLLTIRNRNIPYVYQDERYACSDDFVYIFCARESIVFCYFAVTSAPAAIKMAARFFLHGDHLAKVVLSGAPLLRPGQYHRTFLDSG